MKYWFELKLFYYVRKKKTLRYDRYKTSSVENQLTGTTVDYTKISECHDSHNIKGPSLKDYFNYKSDIGVIIDIKYVGNDCKLSIIQRRRKINQL